MNDPMFVVTVSDFGTLKPLRTITRRVRRPNLKWVGETMKRTWDTVKYDATPSRADVTQHNLIKTCAIIYGPPFETNEVRENHMAKNRFSWRGNEQADRARVRNVQG